MLKNYIKKAWENIEYESKYIEYESKYQRVLKGISTNKLKSGYIIS